MPMMITDNISIDEQL